MRSSAVSNPSELLTILQSPTIIHAFFYGFIASMAAELALFSKAFGPRGALTDKKYASKLYWAVRIGLALGAGIIASAAFSPGISLFVYVYIGISTPGLLNRGASVSGIEQNADQSLLSE
jgi:hypothetical protein